MSFRWPLLALLALLAPLVLAAYWWAQRRRRARAVRYSSVALLRTVVPKRPAWKRHVPVVLLLSGIGVLALASARPHVSREVPYERTSIILALDVSQSMCATDVDPNRLTVAQEAARAFVDRQGDGARMGLVVFSGSAQIVVPPTADREALRAAIDALTTARGTAIGAAIVKGLEAIATVNPDVAPVDDVGGAPAATGARGASGASGASGGAASGATGGAQPGANGFAADVIVVLTDGANTRGIAPRDAIPLAVDRGVRVYTIGFGTAQPTSLSCTRAQLGAAALDNQGFGGFGGGGGGGGRFSGASGGGRFGGAGSPLVADEATLRAVADGTGGEYYAAEDAAQLRQVFDDLPSDIERQREDQEITQWFAALGALLAGGAVLASIRWSAYP